MKLLDPVAIARFLGAYSQMTYDPDNKRYRRKAFYDTQDIATAAGAVPIKFFGEATSSSGSHTRGLHGCNLPNIGVLPGNTIFIVDTITVHILEAITAPKVIDSNKLAEWGVIEGIFVKKEPQMDEFPLAEALVARGVLPSTAGEGAGAAVIGAMHGLGDGKQLTPESYVVIKDKQEFYVPVSFNGTAALSATLKIRVALEGLEIRDR